MRTESQELPAVGIFGDKSRIGDRIETLLRRGRTFSPRASAAEITATQSRNEERNEERKDGSISAPGAFDFNLEWAPEETPTDLAAAPSLFTAIQEQLGLRLEARRERPRSS